MRFLCGSIFYNEMIVKHVFFVMTKRMTIFFKKEVSFGLNKDQSETIFHRTF